MGLRLNLGAGDRHLDTFLCVDIAPPPCEVCDALANQTCRTVDLSRKWEWMDSRIEEVVAYDIIEHIGDGYRLETTAEMLAYDNMRVHGQGGVPVPLKMLHVISGVKLTPFNGRIHFMNELHRVLIPGGKATIETPNAAKGVGFYQDCTHKSGWVLSSFKYFEHGAFAHTRLAKAYGITAAFRILELSESRSNGEDPREEVWKIRAVMEAVK